MFGNRSNCYSLILVVFSLSFLASSPPVLVQRSLREQCATIAECRTATNQRDVCRR